LYGK
jgi:hypothetical protein